MKISVTKVDYKWILKTIWRCRLVTNERGIRWLSITNVQLTRIKVLKSLIFSLIFSVGMFGSAAHQRRAKFWNKSTSLDIDSVERSASDPNRNSFSPRSASPVSLVRNQRKHKSVVDPVFDTYTFFNFVRYVNLLQIFRSDRAVPNCIKFNQKYS